MTRLLARVRRQEGQASLEAIITFPIWLVVCTLFINLLFFLGSAMLVQSTLNRNALQASSLGCVNTHVDGELRNLRGLGMRVVSVSALTPGTQPPNANDPSTLYYRFNRSAMVNAAGNAVPAGTNGTRSAYCTDRLTDRVGNGQWIWMQVHYRQNLWLFGSRDVRRSALVLSQNLND